jgi:hypothetical protein
VTSQTRATEPVNSSDVVTGSWTQTLQTGYSYNGAGNLQNQVTTLPNGTFVAGYYDNLYVADGRVTSQTYNSAVSSGTGVTNFQCDAQSIS